jgi:hypothetical protein
VTGEWEAVLNAAKDDTLGPITIFDTAVFQASEIAVDLLIKLAQDQQAEADAAPDLSKLLTDLDPTKALPPPELAEHLCRLADDLDAARYVADPLRRNAADLAQAARLLYRDATMEKREVEPGQFQWMKRTATTLDGRRREYHLAQVLTLLSDLQDGRRPEGISNRLRALATSIKATATAASPPMPPSAAAGVAGQAGDAKPTDTSGWLTVSGAAQESKINKGEISRACDSGAIHSVGKGTARRLDPASFKVWKQNRQRGAEVKAAVGPITTSAPKAQVSSGLCRQCGDTVTLKDGAGKCPKCGSTKFEPLARNVAQRGRSVG